MAPTVTRSVDIAAPPSVVWRFLATADGLRCWLSPGLEIDLRTGGAYRMPGGDGVTVISGVVLEVVPDTRVVLSWFESGSGWQHPGRLVIALEPISTGTRAHLVHDGFAGIGTDTWPRTYEAYERGADRHRVLDRLADAVVAATDG